MTGPTLVRTLASKLSALLLLAASAHATPSIRYSWDACDPVVLDREFAGPGHYTQTLSVEGLFLLTSLEVSIAIGPGLPSAWAFVAGGCQGGSRLTVRAVGDGCQAIPGLAVFAQVQPSVTDGRIHLRISAAPASAFFADPATRYALARIDFDHSATTTGLVDPPGQCGGGDLPYCFGIESVSINGRGLPGRDFVLESGLLTWNLASTPGQCPFAVAARPSMWGKFEGDLSLIARESVRADGPRRQRRPCPRTTSPRQPPA